MKLSDIKLNKTTGKKTIAEATDLFYYIDSDFKNWGTDVKEKATKEMTLEVHELQEDKTFAQIFTDPEKMYLSQEQIIEFCTNHKEELRTEGWSNFFLFKAHDEFFVARVSFDSGGRLGVGVDELSYGNVWDGDCRRRFVVPQLAIGNSEPRPSDTLDTLTLEARVKALEDWRKRISEPY